LLTGEGLSRVAILASDPKDLNNYLLEKLIRRTGLDKEQFYFGLAEEGWFADAVAKKVKVVMPLGEKALRRTTGNTEIYRWRGRVIENPDFPFFILPTFNPKYLLPRKRPKDAPKDPEVMNRPARFQGRFQRDLQYARFIAQNGFKRAPVSYLLDPSPDEFAKWVDSYLRALDSGVWIRLAFDTETPYKVDHASDEEEQEEKEKFNERNLDIIRWSFSYEFGKAVSIPNHGVYRKSIERFLREAGDKVTTNGRDFDYPVAEYNGYELNGRHFDTFDLMKFWQSDLDKGLEVASIDTTDLLPWKHMSDARPDWYSAVDADASWREADYIIREIQQQGAWEVFLETFVDLMPHLVRAGNRGNAIDLGYQAELQKTFDEESARLDVEIQKVVPVELKPRQRYKRWPFETNHVNQLTGDNGLTDIYSDPVTERMFRKVLEPNEVKVCSACGKWPVTKGEHTSRVNLGEKVLIEERHHKFCERSLLYTEQATIPLTGGPSLEETPCSCKSHGKGWPKRKWDSSGVTKNPCHAAEIKTEVHPTEEWDEILPFNVNSSQQLIAYMKAHRHPVAKNPDDPDKDAADAQHLMMLARTYKDKHPIYGLAGEKKKVDKAESTYVWIPRRTEEIDGQTVHLIGQTYKNVPNTLRLSGKAYNLMNVGKKEDKNRWAVMARRQIVARPGYVFVNADSTSVEGVMQGWYMGDEHFMWLANQSVHAWLTTKRLGWDFNPDTVDKVKREQKKLYDAFKVAFYTTSFGGSPYGMYMANRDVFPTAKDAEKTQDRLYQLIPSLEAFHYHVRYLAQKQGYIESPWKWRGYFYDVYTYKRDRFGNIEYTETGRPKLKLSKDGKRVVAVLPQHSNAMFARQNMKRIGESEWGQYMPANHFVHDGYTLEVPIAKAEAAEDFLLNLLSRPIPEMGGLRVGAASDIGYNWADTDPKRSLWADGNPSGMTASRKVVIEKQDLLYMPTPRVSDEMARAA
jgi:DNA polymerase I-like protein with 3'-5' exonuclease and polymerase domains